MTHSFPPRRASDLGGEGDATAFVRAHEFVLAKEEEPALAARIEHILRAGPMAQIDARLLTSDQVIEVAIARAPKSLSAGQQVRLRPVAVRAFPHGWACAANRKRVVKGKSLSGRVTLGSACSHKQ